MLMVHNGNVYMDDEGREAMRVLGGPELPPDGPVAMWRAWAERHLATPVECLEDIYRTTVAKGILDKINEVLAG